MKIVVEVIVGNDAMSMYGQVARAISRSFESFTHDEAPVEPVDAKGGRYPIKDVNGNTVGYWQVKL